MSFLCLESLGLGTRATEACSVVSAPSVLPFFGQQPPDALRLLAKESVRSVGISIPVIAWWMGG